MSRFNYIAERLGQNPKRFFSSGMVQYKAPTRNQKKRINKKAKKQVI